MAEGDHFPLHYPGDARPALSSEAQVCRIAREAQIGPDSRVLTLGMGATMAPLALAREPGCSVSAFDADEADARKLRERIRSQGLEDRISSQQGSWSGGLPFADSAFDAVFVDARAPFQLEAGLKTLRRLLAPRGRVCLVYPVRVGRHRHPAVERFWEQKLGESLVQPREGLQRLERAGYEPLLIETIEDSALGEFYRQVESSLGNLPEGDARAARLREEIALFRSQAGRSTVTFAVIVGRRKEPGEKPAPPRSE